MPAIALVLVATVAVCVIGSYFFGEREDGRRPPPPSPSYTHRRPPATSHIAPRTSSSLSDELLGVEDSKKLREEARRRGREMSEAYSRAKAAQKKGYRGAAQEHRQRGDAHKSSMEDLDMRAAKIIFRENNKVSS